jgi:hypothetical protein
MGGNVPGADPAPGFIGRTVDEIVRRLIGLARIHIQSFHIQNSIFYIFYF